MMRKALLAQLSVGIISESIDFTQFGRMRITLNGSLGSGKSTIGRRLSAIYEAPFISTGMLFREIGKIANLDALQTNLAAENNSEIDFAVDRKIKELNATQKNFIVDSRMAWHFVESSVDIFLSVSLDTAISRIMTDNIRTNETYANANSARQSLVERRDSENRRYKRLYGVNIEDPKNYDLIIITDGASVDEVVSVITHFIERRDHKSWIPKSRLVPMINIRDASGLTHTVKSSPGDQAKLPLLVSDNFGFYFGSGHSLVTAFHCESALVPYIDEQPTFLNPGSDIVALAKTTMKKGDFYDWEEIAGQKLAFTSLLPQNPSLEKNLH